MSETLKVVVDRPDAAVAILRTDGYINNTGGEEIAKEAYALLGGGVTRLLLDLEKTKIVNSIGISILTSSIRLSMILMPHPRLRLDFRAVAISGVLRRAGSKPWPASATSTSR